MCKASEILHSISSDGKEQQKTQKLHEWPSAWLQFIRQGICGARGVRGGTGRFTARSGACVYKATGSVCACVCVGKASKHDYCQPQLPHISIHVLGGKKVCGGQGTGR